MFRKSTIVTLLIALAAIPFLASCASTEPNSLTGRKDAPVYNDKGRVVGYQAR